MACRICMEMERSLNSAQQPDMPEQMLGLTEAGMRNRAHQREERLSKMISDLGKHKKICLESRGEVVEPVTS